jgi:DNA replication protein DnaD
MSEKSTFIKLNRKILKWRWYQDANTFRVFVHLLLLANVTDRDFEQVTVRRGQLVTSRKHLSRDLKISEQSVRTALEHLKSTSEITISTTSKFSIITINNYDLYQRVTHSPTSNQPATNQRPTSNQPQYKNGKECIRMVKNEREGALAPLGRFKNVFLTQNELDELRTKFPNDYEAKIERLSRYQESKGRTFDNHFATLLDWLEKDLNDKRSDERETNKASYDISEIDKINLLEDF